MSASGNGAAPSGTSGRLPTTRSHGAVGVRIAASAPMKHGVAHTAWSTTVKLSERWWPPTRRPHRVSPGSPKTANE